jgi:5,10-methylenetetrahydromethanopterin reductase
MEIWLHAFAIPGQVAATARAAEEWGFAGLLVADSQNLTADIWVELALAGAATSRLRVGPGVTNPVTRHVAVTASAAATLQAETGGRCTLGFAQGDSALSQVGLKRLSVQRFERELANLQGLLRGESVPLNGDACAIRWLAGVDLPKVPVHAAATGPRTIAAAARHADGVDLTLGAEPDRLRWGIELTRSAGPAGLSVGAYVNVAVDPDAGRARDLVRGSTATFARFSAPSRRSAQLSQATRRGVSRAAGGYEEARHGDATAPGARQLDDEFIDRFAVCGPAAIVVGRLRQIEACGIDRLIVVPASLDTPGGVTGQINERFATEVLPALTP